jgi:integrase
LGRVLGALRERKHSADDVAMLLLLTGCRKEEIAGLTWPEVQPDRLAIDPARHKSAQPLLVPLSRQARALLPPRATGCVWPTQINWFHWQKKIFERTGTSGWHRHDLRRTVATLLANRFKYPPHIIEAVLGTRISAGQRLRASTIRTLSARAYRSVAAGELVDPWWPLAFG